MALLGPPEPHPGSQLASWWGGGRLSLDSLLLINQPRAIQETGKGARVNTVRVKCRETRRPTPQVHPQHRRLEAVCRVRVCSRALLRAATGQHQVRGATLQTQEGRGSCRDLPTSSASCRTGCAPCPRRAPTWGRPHRRLPMDVLPGTVRSGFCCLILSGNAVHPWPDHRQTRSPWRDTGGRGWPMCPGPVSCVHSRTSPAPMTCLGPNGRSAQ